MKIFFTWILTLLCLLTSSSSSFSQVTHASSLFWEISGNELPHKSYLYGTIHFVKKQDFFLPDVVLDQFNRCHTLATENSMLYSYMSVESVNRVNQQKLLPRKQTIRDYISTSDFYRLTSYLTDSLRVGKKQYASVIRYKPLFIGGYIVASKLNFRDKDLTGYETEFERMALRRNRGKNPMMVTGLENYRHTLGYLDSLEIEQQTEELMHDMYVMHAKYLKIVALYQQQDISTIYEISALDETSHNVLLKQRNLSWMNKIENVISSKSAFIAVGAAHLSGEYGLINLLRAKGYTLTPIYGTTKFSHQELQGK